MADNRHVSRLRSFSLRDSKLAHVPLWAVLGVAMIAMILTWPAVDYRDPSAQAEREVTYLPLPQPVHPERRP